MGLSRTLSPAPARVCQADACPGPWMGLISPRALSGHFPVALRGTPGPSWPGPKPRPCPAPPSQGPRGGGAGRVSRAASRRRDAPPRVSFCPMGDRLTKFLCAAAETRALIGRGAGGVSGHAAPGAIASWRDGGERWGVRAGPDLRPLTAPRPGSAHADGGRLRDARAGPLQRRVGALGGGAGAGRYLWGVPGKRRLVARQVPVLSPPYRCPAGLAPSPRRLALSARVLRVQRHVCVCALLPEGCTDSFLFHQFRGYCSRYLIKVSKMQGLILSKSWFRLLFV